MDEQYDWLRIPIPLAGLLHFGWLICYFLLVYLSQAILTLKYFLLVKNLYLLVIFFQFIREYTGKVDDLVKDKLESQNEVKAKEKEEKDLVAQQVVNIICFLFLGYFHHFKPHCNTLLFAEHVCPVASTCITCSANARHGRSSGDGWAFHCTPSYGRDGNATNATIWHAPDGKLLN